VSGAVAVAVRDLEVRYHGGKEAAVSGVGFTVSPGEGLLITGGPAAGKTSVLRALLGLVPAGGEIELFGGPPGSSATGMVGYGPEGRDYAGYLTLREVVRTVTRLRAPRDVAGSCEDALDRAGLSYVADYRTRRLDEEGFRRLSLAVAITCDPALIVLDEPWMMPETLDEIAAARARGAAVIAASRRPAGFGPALGRRMALRDGRPR
jgi:ABC-type multidrug transport system ATPase subunit